MSKSLPPDGGAQALRALLVYRVWTVIVNLNWELAQLPLYRTRPLPAQGAGARARTRVAAERSEVTRVEE